MNRNREKYMRSAVLMILAATVMLWLWACAAMQKDYPRLSSHPEMEGEDLRFCTNCHDSQEGSVPFERFVHNLFFSENHSQSAGRWGDVCNMCHKPSFCSDCHGVRVELKPSIKNQSDNYRRMPHRGDYLTRHRIDGRINPVPCYRCHGNPKTSHTCKPCHG